MFNSVFVGNLPDKSAWPNRAPGSAPQSGLEFLDSFVARYNLNGTVAWTAGRKSGIPNYSADSQPASFLNFPGGAQPGSLRTLRRLYGIVNNSIVVGSVSEEWPTDGVPGVYVYNEDGLYAGQVLGLSPADPNQPTWRYALGAEGIAGDIRKALDGSVYFFAHWVNEARVYRISGWTETDWEAADGIVPSIPQGYVGVPNTPEPTGPNGNGTGLLGTYYTDDSWGAGGGEAVRTRIDSTIDFRWNRTNPMFDVTVGLPIKDHPAFSIQWTGSVLARRTGWHMFRKLYDGGKKNVGSVNAMGVVFRRPFDVVASCIATGCPPEEQWGLDELGSKVIWLQAGERYPVDLKITSDGFGGDPLSIRLEWAEPECNGVFTTIPSSQLFPYP
jgi:hypothetical protein